MQIMAWVIISLISVVEGVLGHLKRLNGVTFTKSEDQCEPVCSSGT